MLFFDEMRRSSLWFFIACLWAVDVAMTIARGRGREAWLPALITAAFIAAGIFHRRRETKLGVGRPLRLK